MKLFINIISIILIVLYLALMIETMIYLKKSEGKLMEEVRPKMLKRINISIVLIILIFITNIIRVFIK